MRLANVEIRNPKHKIRNKDKMENAKNSKTKYSNFLIFDFWLLDLFRISIFGFRHAYPLSAKHFCMNLTMSAYAADNDS